MVARALKPVSHLIEFYQFLLYFLSTALLLLLLLADGTVGVMVNDPPPDSPRVSSRDQAGYHYISVSTRDCA